MSALRAEEETGTEEMEDLESFRHRARSFITANLAPKTMEEMRLDYSVGDEESELADIAHERELQRMLYDAGLAGICFPRAYGGQGLTPAHQMVFNEEIVGRDFPWRIQVPTFVPCAAVILEFGTEEQKQRHLPPILRGEQLWMQFLSEPSGGSDVAAALTTAVRDGDQWVLNGSKIWTTGAWWSDWGLCLARTNWDVPKHRGLTVFMLPIHQPNVEVHRIEMLNGSREFCQEFLTDVIVPDADRIGDVDDGWTVGTRWMFHERMLFNSPYASHPVGMTHGSMDANSVFTVGTRSGPAGGHGDPGDDRRGADARAHQRRGGEADQREHRGRKTVGPGGGDRAAVQGFVPGADPHPRVRGRRIGGRGLERRRSDLPRRHQLPHPAGRQHRGRDARDGAQRGRGARAGHAAGAPPGQGRAVPRRAAEPPELALTAAFSQRANRHNQGRRQSVATATVNGVTLAYETIGEGRPWVITPGGRFTKDEPGVRQLAEALAAQGNRVLIWDRPNCGESDVCFEGPSESAMQADTLVGLLEHLEMTPAVIIGGSGGARVSLLAGAHPGAATGLAVWWISGGVYGLLTLAMHYCGGSLAAAWTSGGMEAVADLPEWQEVIRGNAANRQRILDQDPKTFIAAMERWMMAYVPDRGAGSRSSARRRRRDRHPCTRLPQRRERRLTTHGHLRAPGRGVAAGPPGRAALG